MLSLASASGARNLENCLKTEDAIHMTIHVAPPTEAAIEELFPLWKAQYPRFRTLLEEGTPKAKALRFLGLALWQDERLDEAANVLTVTASLAPGEPTVLSELGSLLCATGRKAEALSFLSASLKLDPCQARVWINVAAIGAETGNRLLAEKAFLAALDLAPDTPEALAGLGLLYIEMRRFDEAARLLRAAVERGVSAMAVYACLGQTLYLLGEFAQASRAFEKAARACPGEAKIAQKYAEARFIEMVIEARPLELALDVYRAAAGDYAEDVSAMCRTAFQTLSAYGRTEAAIRVGEALLEENPDDPILLYHLDALAGRMIERAPRDYLTACFDKFAPIFDKQLVEILNYDAPAKCQSLLVEAGAKFSRALDLGCGTGLAARYLASFGAELTGVDISPGMLERAKERGLYRHLIEAEALDYLSGCATQFDLVASLDVLVYFGDLSALFCAIADRLSPGGYFVFSHEIGEREGYALQRSGRFAHHPDYVDALCESAFARVASVELDLRLEANRPVRGRLVLLRRL
jgi:predicted TPR repeat methyltransferase/Flp pilus assembly protein TadD